MKPVRMLVLAIGVVVGSGLYTAGSASAESPSLTEKINAYVECINRLHVDIDGRAARRGLSLPAR